MMKMEIRLAALEMEQRIDGVDDLIVSGYAVIFDSPTVVFEYDGIQYSEVIKRGALDKADMSDVVFKYNHSSNVMVMARTRNKTLSLLVDEKGLKISANLAKTSGGKDLYELIRRGDVDKMSFAMQVTKDSYYVKTRTRAVEKIKRLGDVSAVDMPAYDDTSISVRDYFTAQQEMEKRAELEIMRKRLIIATYF